MKMKFALPLLALVYSIQSFALDLIPGTYEGTSINDDVTMYVKAIPGRTGSFLAVITKEDTLGFAYLVDKFNSNKYGLVPLQALDNNVIGSNNHNPSMVLTVNEDRPYNRITLTSNNSDNVTGFISPMSFKYKNKSKKSKWIPSANGTFKYDGERRAATVTPQDINHEATLSIKVGSNPGDYVLREARPGLHLVLKSSLSTTGVEINEQTNLIAFFTNDREFLGHKDKLILMDTASGKIATFKSKN